MWSPFKKLSLGASARTFAVFNADDSQNVIDYSTTYSADDSATDESDYYYSLYSSILNYSTNYPTQISGGFAFFPSPYFLISSDVDYFTAASDDLNEILIFFTWDRLFINEANAIRCGVFTNNSNVPAPTSPSSYNRLSIDLIGASVGYSIFGPTNSITLGVIYATGAGSAQVYSGSSTIIDYDQSELTVLISNAFLLRSVS